MAAVPTYPDFQSFAVREAARPAFAGDVASLPFADPELTPPVFPFSTGGNWAAASSTPFAETMHPSAFVAQAARPAFAGASTAPFAPQPKASPFAVATGRSPFAAGNRWSFK